MLLELVVENYAVIERLRVRFHSGLNLLTGETGSGKSIVVDARQGSFDSWLGGADCLLDVGMGIGATPPRAFSDRRIAPQK